MLVIFFFPELVKKLADVKQDKTNPKNIVFSQSVKCQQQFIVNLNSVHFAKRQTKLKQVKATVKPVSLGLTLTGLNHSQSLVDSNFAAL